MISPMAVSGSHWAIMSQSPFFMRTRAMSGVEVVENDRWFPPAGSTTVSVPLVSHASRADFSTFPNLKCSSQDEVNQMSFTGCFGENGVIRWRHSPDIYPSAESI